jgi:conjugal transfer pilus assembly protein TraB
MANPTSPKSQQIKKKQMLILGGVGLVVLALAMGSAFMMGGNKKEAPPPIVSTTRGLIDASTGDAVDKEKWRERSAQDIEKLRQQMGDQQRVNGELQKALDDIAKQRETEKSTAGKPVAPPSMGNVVPPPMQPPVKNSLTGLLGPLVPPKNTEGKYDFGGPNPQAPIGDRGIVLPNGGGTINNGQPAVAIDTVTFDPVKAKAAETTPVATPLRESGSGRPYRIGPKGERIYLEASAYNDGAPDKTYVPSGSFARAVVLGGVDAPTGGQAQGNPTPVLLRVIGDAVLPGGARVNLKDCLVTGNALGDLSSERVLIRIQRMSCRIGDDKMADIGVIGHVDGEDGKAGVRSRLVSKTGSALANALYSGIVSSLGSSISSNTQQTVTTGLGSVTQIKPGEMATSALGAGVSKAADRLANYYINLADKMFPVLELDSLRMADIVFMQGFSIESI